MAPSIPLRAAFRYSLKWRVLIGILQKEVKFRACLFLVLIGNEWAQVRYNVVPSLVRREWILLSELNSSSKSS